MNRRNFLTRSGLALGALIVGDEVLEMLDRLTHRKVYALGGVPQPEYRMVGTLWVRESRSSEWVAFDRTPVVDGVSAFTKRVPPRYTEAQVSVMYEGPPQSLNVAYSIVT